MQSLESCTKNHNSSTEGGGRQSLSHYIIVLQRPNQDSGGYRKEAGNYSCLCYYITVLQGLEQTTGGYRREAGNYIVVYVII